MHKDHRQWLDITDYMIFLELFNDPLINYNELSKKIGKSFQFVRDHVSKLKRENFLRQDKEIVDPILGPRTQTEVEGVYAPQALGLQRIHVFFSGLQSKEDEKLLLKGLEAHPYTHFQVLTFSPKLGVYAQFDVPRGKADLIREYVERMQDYVFFRNSQVQSTNYSATSETRFEAWDRLVQDWRIGEGATAEQDKDMFSQQFDTFCELRDEERKEAVKEKNAIRQKPVKRFSELDLKLVRELTINAKASVKNLSLFYGKDPSTISKKLKQIRQTLVPKALLYYDRRMFNLTQSLFVQGSFATNEVRDKILAFLKQRWFPFSSWLAVERKNFVWYVLLPPNLVADFLEFANLNARTLQVHYPQLRKSKTYYFYFKNYDFSTGKWITSSKYIIDEPLKAIKQP